MTVLLAQGNPDLQARALEEIGNDYRVVMLADSVSTEGRRLMSMLITYPLTVHAQLLRHRVFSHSVASMRAMPSARVLQRATYTQREVYMNARGMNSNVPVTGWRLAAWRAVEAVVGGVARWGTRIGGWLGVHKQHANRFVMAQTWVTQIISATDWASYFRLRCEDADPAHRTIARLMRDAQNASLPRQLYGDEWHVPLQCTDVDLQRVVQTVHVDRDHAARMICAGRLASMSFLSHETRVPDPLADYDRATRLTRDGHWSPFEPIARPAIGQRCGNFRGWWQLRADLDPDFIF